MNINKAYFYLIQLDFGLQRLKMPRLFHEAAFYTGYPAATTRSH